MYIDPDDPDLPVNRRERQQLRTIAERVRQRREMRAELNAARVDAADVAETGPAGQPGSHAPAGRRRRRQKPRTVYHFDISTGGRTP